MRMTALAVAISLLLALAACERKGGNPPKPVASALEQPAGMVRTLPGDTKMGVEALPGASYG